jgi:DNA-binding transcriptional LysR family regulator
MRLGLLVRSACACDGRRSHPYVLLRVLPELQRRHPKLRLELIESPTQTLLNELGSPERDDAVNRLATMLVARSPLTSFVASCAGHRPALVIIADRVQCDCHIVRECYRSLCRILCIQEQEHRQ